MVELSHHGNFDLTISGNKICATLCGSWNSETAEAEAGLAASGFHLDAANP